MLRVTTIVLLGLFLCLPSIPVCAETLLIGDFSGLKDSESLPKDWEPLHFKDIERHTRYSPVHTDKGYAIKAESQNSSSGLIRRIRIDPLKYPVVEWHWKISNVYENGNAREKSGDDYPARLYITFSYEPDKVGFFQKIKFEAIKVFHGEYPPTSALNYIWASQVEKGEILPNPFTDRVKMIAVESGSANAGQWITERRNILDDYRKIYGEDPPEISGVAIMTDSDNTKESAEAWYGDIVFTAAEDRPPTSR